MSNKNTLPPNLPLVRTIQYTLWESGISLFDGTNPVYVHSTQRDKDYWSYYIELIEGKPMCVTRLNGVIKYMFAALGSK